MTQTTRKKYSFVSAAAPEDAFIVIRFHGREGFSQTYSFDIEAMSDQSDLDLDGVLDETATLIIHRSDGDVPFKGIVTDVEMSGSYEGYIFYRFRLVPKFRQLTLTSHNQIFLNKTLPEMLTDVLRDGGLTENDFDLRLQGDYQPWDYVCQYQESHLGFVSRWMERDGLFYWFEQGDEGERLVISDKDAAESFMPQGRGVVYAEPSGLDAAHAEETIRNFICRQHPVPALVHLSDYNYRRPSLRIEGRAAVSDKGVGEVHLYGHHARTPEEADRLARIRAEEILCRSREFYGHGGAPFLRPGYFFELEGHYRDEYNQKYLTTAVEHKGSQTAFIISGMGLDIPGMESELFYRNAFKAIEAGARFRPPRVAKRPKIYGAMNAVIDAEGSGQYAELDHQGRYKVILPFDQSGRSGGKASAWLRMVQPYSGQDHGFHFPLHKGTEVLLHFLDGNPDRPVIAGVVPNPDAPSPVTVENQTMNAITSSSGSKIHLEDEKGSQRILLHSPTAGSFVRIGAPNDPDEGPKWGEKPDWKFAQETKDGINLVSTQGFTLKAGFYNEIVMGEKIGLVGGGEGYAFLIEKTLTSIIHKLQGFLGLSFEVEIGGHWVARDSVTEMCWLKKKVEGEKLTVAEAEERAQELVQQARGDVTDAIGNADEAVGELNDAVGQADIVKGQVQEAVGEANTAKGQLDEVIGNAEHAMGEVNEAAASAEKTTGEFNNIVAAGNKAVAEINEAAVSINTVSAEVSRINDLDTTV